MAVAASTWHLHCFFTYDMKWFSVTVQCNKNTVDYETKSNFSTSSIVDYASCLDARLLFIAVSETKTA